MLRWSGENTIEAHRDVVRERGHVWWGWWAKAWEPIEPTRLRAARRLISSNQLRVALVNRKQDTFFIAACDALGFNEGQAGVRIGSPEPEATPEYYRNEAHGAWFRFTRIEQIDRATYQRNFGSYPVGDPTLYDVVEDHQELVLRPSPAWSMRPIETKSDTILHLSDLHIGAAHGFPPPGNSSRRSADLAETITRAVEYADAEVGVLIVSGDLICDGAAENFASAHQFLTDLQRQLGLDREHCIVVPGNSDFHKLHPGVQPRRDYRHENDYRLFARSFYLRDIQDLETLYRYSTPSGWDISCIALNSARLRGEDSLEYGFVGAHRYSAMLEYALQTVGVTRFSSRDKKLGLAVMHHHVMPVYPEDDLNALGRPSLAGDAGDITNRLQEAGVSAVLHGHHHLPFFGYQSKSVVRNGVWEAPSPFDGGVYVWGAGSAGADKDHLPELLRLNSMNMYTLGLDTVNVACYTFGPREAVRLLMRSELPLF
ncbi:metallophosphoesterase family protein [Geodermatophilus amargosae]|uniref:metallophosphoesterase family protein n=1 Tax=Geodermatophilus amargosae TaxID=1296565 RepID=UPI003F807648